MNRLDAEMLLGSINNLGQSFAGARREKATEDYRTQALARDEERQRAAEAHYQAMEKAQSDNYARQQSAAVDADDQKTFAELTKLNASGALTDESRTSVNAWLKAHNKWGKVGIALQPPTSGTKNVGSSSVGEALRLADQYDAQSAQEPDPSKKAQQIENAKILRESARAATAPKVDPGSYDTETIVYPKKEAEKETPETTTGGFFGIGATKVPAKPAVPEQPERRITRKIPHRPNAGGMNVDQLRQDALNAIARGAAEGDVRTRFKTMTGQDL